MLSYTFSRSDTTPLLCVLLYLFTDQIEGLDQLQLLKVTHTSIEAGARHIIDWLVRVCVCTTIDPRPSSKLVWPRPPQPQIVLAKRLEFETTSKPSLHWGRRSNQAKLVGWADHRDSKVNDPFPHGCDRPGKGYAAQYTSLLST